MNDTVTPPASGPFSADASDSWDRDFPAFGRRSHRDGRRDYLVRWQDRDGERVAVLATAPDATPEQARRQAEAYLAALASHRSHGPAPDPAYLAARERCPRPLPIAGFYRQVRQLDIDFGPSFRAVVELWKGDYEAIGRIELDAALPADRDRYLLHPVFLDACLQIFGATLYDDPERKTFLPVGMESFRFDRPGARTAWSHVKLRQPVREGDTATVADIRFFDRDLQAVGGIDGFSLLLGDADTFSEADYPAIRQALYRVRWEQVAKPAVEVLADAPEAERPLWLVLAADADAEALARELARRGQRAVTTGAVADLQSRHGERFVGVIDWRAVRPVSVDEAAFQDALAPSLLAAQALAAQAGSGAKRYVLAGHGAVAIAADDAIDPLATARWGLGRTLAREQAGVLEALCVDLDQTDPAACLVAEILAGDGEEQAAWRQGRRHIARLAPVATAGAGPGQGAYRLAISAYGSFDQLYFRPLERRAPDETEVEIAVRATGLNFKDVLHALGMLAIDGNQSGAGSADEMLFGGDCAGEVVRVGRAVRGLKPGDRVLACMAFGCLGSHVNVEQRFVAPIPAGLDHGEAATLPTAFITAYYALVTCARLRRGERVLIHAGAGAVGMAAIQLARLYGAEVYATASEPKQARLREMGVADVASSRDLDFASRWSRERLGGFDVILNSLGGDFIRASHDLLRPDGRFVEIGKLGILSEEEALRRRPGSRYCAFDLMDLARDQPGLIAEILATVIQQIAQNRLEALPQTVFPAEQSADAFRCMAQARHVGKIVIEHAERDGALRFDPERRYLVSGGLGALGLALARWLVRRGARQLVLLGRSAPDAATEATLNALREVGVAIDCRRVDVGDAAQVDALFAALATDGPALDGIFHAAGLLDDATLPQQDWPRFQRVLHPKARGAWHLHLASRDLDLRCFVCFSSIAGLFGAPGQANYAAASAFLDGLAHHRRQQGLPALSIDWGPWAGAGMAARLEASHQGRFDSGGVIAIEQLEGLHALECLLHGNPTQAAVFPADWPRLLRRFGGATPPFYRDVAARHAAAEQTAERPDDLNALLKEATPAQRPALLQTALQKLVGAVVRAEPDRIDPQAPLRDLGVDSLMGVELRSKLERSLGRAVPIALLLQGPSVATLGNAILALLGLGEADTAETPVAGSWLVRRPRATEPKLRLFCFPPLGGGAGLFHGWQDALPDAVEVVAIQLPGREERLDEPALTDFSAVVGAIAAAIEPLLDRPFAFYGHSMGTLLAYETACAVRERYGRTPRRLLVGALWAPTAHEAQRAAGTYDRFDLDQLVLPTDLNDNSDYLDNLRRIARADAALLRDYRWPGHAPLHCPVVAFHGEDDPIAGRDDLAGWATVGADVCEVETIGGGHMFMIERRTELLPRLAARLNETLEDEKTATP